MARSIGSRQRGHNASAPEHASHTHACPQLTSTHSRGAARHTTHSSMEAAAVGSPMGGSSAVGGERAAEAASAESMVELVSARCLVHSAAVACSV